MKDNSRLWLALLLVLIITGAFLLNNSFNNAMANGTFDGSWSSDDEIPQMTIYDQAGNPHNITDFRGKPVVLHFWGTWSDGSVTGLPALVEKWQAYGEQVHFLFVTRPNNSQETMESVQDFMDTNGYDFPVYYDTTLEAGAALSIESLPTTFFINSEGKCSLYGNGPLTPEDLQTGINDILP